jgi:glutamate racemase
VIGILDWGIGGLGFYQALHAREPNLPVYYVSDSGFMPYGKVPSAVLRQRVLDVATVMRAHGVTHLVIACNAASTVLRSLGMSGTAGALRTSAGSLEVTGVIAHGIALARVNRAKHLAILGGARTVRSNLYGRALRTAKRQVTQRIAQPLSAYVERGELHSRALRHELSRVLAPVAQCDAVLLACTHYPALLPALHEQMPNATWLDPSATMAEWVQNHWLRSMDRTANTTTFSTTGDVGAMRKSARLAFDVRPTRIVRLHIA